MTSTRQLAAILFTDIEGYTAIMQKEEDKAIAMKDRHREVLEKQHKKHNGQLKQYYGDGTLSIFPSVIEAVQCAITMQQDFIEQQGFAYGLRLGKNLASCDLERGSAQATREGCQTVAGGRFEERGTTTGIRRKSSAS